MDIRTILTLARYELTLNVRNRWTLLFAAVFSLLALAISYFGMATAGAIGFQGLARTSASLLNLVLYLVPLVALMMGTLSFTNEKSMSESLFSQPITRTEILLGKLLGLFGSICVSTMLGFGLAGMIIAAKAGTGGALRYPLLVGYTLLLAMVFLGISSLIALAGGRGARALGVAIFVWFFFVFFYDLLTIGATFFLRERMANTLLFTSLFGNPVGMVRVSSLMAIDGEQVFGAAGAALTRALGGRGASLLLLLTGLLVWIVLPVAISRRLLRRQDI